MNKISIIGSGHVGVSLFCDFLVRLPGGSERTRLFHVREDRADRWKAGGEITFNDLFSGTSHPVDAGARHFDHLFAGGSLDWLQESRYIVITVPDIPYLRPRIFDHLLEHLDLEDKVLVLCRGGQGGTPYVATRIRGDRRLHGAHTVMIEDSFYGTRFLGNQVDCKRKYKINVAIVSHDERQTLARLQAIFPAKPGSPLPSWPHFEVRPLADLLFDPLGYIIHVGVAFSDRNIARTRSGEVYTHYVDGIDRELAAKLHRLDNERVAIAAAFGVHADTFPQTIARQYGKPLLPDFHDMMQSCRDIYKSRSAASFDELLNSRFVSEDIPALFTMVRLAEIAGCAVPATTAHLDDVRRKLRSYGIDEAPLVRYANAFPDTDTVEALVDLLNHPIPGALAPGRAASTTHASIAT